MLRIALIGPESTGKSTLAHQLGAHFKAPVVEEFARGYVERLNRPYTLEDILHCAKEQLRLEEAAAAAGGSWLFCDTEFILAKIWCLDVFHTVPDWIPETIERHRYDLFLLTSPDLPFEPDPVRENPHRRDEFFDIYRDELKHYGFSYTVISGLGEKRLQAAIEAVQALTASETRSA